MTTYNLFNGLREYHQYIKDYYLHKYAYRAKYLLDVGSASLKSMRFWMKNQIQNVFAIEPSEDAFILGTKKLRTLKHPIKIHYIRATGQSNWRNQVAALTKESIYPLKLLENQKFDCITFEFTFHYMLDNTDQLMNNIVSHSRNGTYVVVHILDGTKVMWAIEKYKGRYSVRLNNETVYELKKVGDRKISVYMKGAQGLDNVIEEYVIEPPALTKLFESHGYKLLEYKPFAENLNEEYKLAEYEFKVSEMYITYVFQYDV